MTSQWIDPHEGFAYTPEALTITSAFQGEKHAACGIDTTVFAGQTDPSFFIGKAIEIGIHSGITAEGNVNMLQWLTLYHPLPIDTPLTGQGVITGVTRVPRGRTVDTDAWFEDADGVRRVSAKRRSLKPDPDAGKQRGAGERPSPVIDNPASLPVVATYTLTPEAVCAYSMEGNSIHYEMEAANRAGFRAPIIGGGQGVHYLMAALYTHAQPEHFNAAIYFRRPIFWDDVLNVRIRTNAGIINALCLEKDGKVATEIELSDLKVATT